MRTVIVHSTILLTVFFVSFSIKGFGQTKHVQLIPLAVGNYWIYSTSNKFHPLDTIKIIGTRVIDGDTAYVFNNHEMMFERNDSIYNFQTQRIGIPFKCLEYFPSEKYLEYTIVIGGDVLGRRTVSKIKRPYKLNGKEYSNCFKFSSLDNHQIICMGVGILRSETNTVIRTLIEYQVKE